MPDLLAGWNFERNTVNPSDIFKTSNKKVWWKCQICGNSWQAVIAEKTKGRKKCPKCKNSQDK